MNRRSVPLGARGLLPGDAGQPVEPSATPLAPALGAERGAASAVGTRAARGALWTLGGYAAGSGLRLAGNVLLSRLLFPEAFGLMAVVNAVVLGLSLASDVGLGQAIIQSERGEDPKFLRTGFTIQILRRLGLGLLCMALAGPVADLYASSGPMALELTKILPLIGLSIMVDGFISMRAFLCRRRLTLGRLTAVDLASQVAALVVMIGWAVVSPTVWALVAGNVAKSAAWVLLSHLALDGPRDRLGWDPSAARAMFSFGKWILVSTLLGFLAGQADRLVLAKLVPLGVLGVYGIAATLAAVPSEAFTKLASAVIFPVLSRLKSDEAELRRASQRVRAPIVLGCGAIVSALLAGGGTTIIEVLYDDRYAAAGWMLRALAVGAWFKTLDAVQGATLLALGRTRSLAGSNAVRAAGTFVLAGSGWAVAGFPGAILGLVAADAAKYIATAALLGSVGGTRAWTVDLGPTLRVALTAGLGWFVSRLPGGISDGFAGALGALVALACWAPLAWGWYAKRRDGGSREEARTEPAGARGPEEQLDGLRAG